MEDVTNCRRQLLAFCLWLLAAGFLMSCTGGTERNAPNLRSAPDFSLPSVDGGQVELSDYRGKVVLLTFWATWCGPCKAVIPHEVELQERYGSQGFAVLGLSLDQDPSDVESFLERRSVNYPILYLDEPTKAAFGGVPTIPYAILIDREGTIRKEHLGFSLEILGAMERKIQSLLVEEAPIRVGG